MSTWSNPNLALNKYLVIRSLSRLATSTSSSNCVIQSPPNYNLYTYGPMRLRLAHYFGYSTVYNVNSSSTNLDFSVGASNYTATVAAGLYDANSFASTL